jgi:phage terminase small subunit
MSTETLAESLNSIPLPKDVRHQRFADLVLRGSSLLDAYLHSGYKSKGSAAKAAASRLRAHADVSAYITAVQKQAASGAVMDRQEALEYLTRNIRTPIGEVDETSDLAQEVTRDEVGEETIRTKIKMPGKINAVDRLAKMLGWYAPEKVEVSADDELADLIRSTRAGQK